MRRASASTWTRSACATIGATWRCGKLHSKQPMKRSNLGIAVVGSGRIGTLRARLAAKHPAVRFLAVSDRDPARAQVLAEQAGADFHSSSNEGIINHPEVTAVIVSTPVQE